MFKLFLFLVFLFCTLDGYSQIQNSTAKQNPTGSEERDSLIEKIQNYIFKEKYDSVFKYTDQLIDIFPEDPSGFFLKANAYQTIMRDYRVNIYETEFDSLITLAVDISKKAVEKNPIAENYFLYGSSEGYRCLHWFRTGKWLKAIGSAIKTLKLLHKALEKDPDFVDPLFGLAIYDYGKSKVQLLGLGLFSDKTEQIIENLNTVYEKSRFLSINALFALQLVHFELGDTDKVQEINKELISLFPQHPVCHYYYALNLEEQDSLMRAKQQWLTVLNKIEDFNPSSNNYLAECNYRLAKIAYQTGHHQQARAYIQEAARHIREYREEDELNGALYTFEDIKDQINDALQKWELNP
jgi:tetratricopeptide (TPR) repeat protein